MKRHGILNSNISRVLSAMGIRTESQSLTADCPCQRGQSALIWL